MRGLRASSPRALEALLGIVERLLTKAEGPLTPGQEQLLLRVIRQGLVMNHPAENARMMAQLCDKAGPARGEGSRKTSPRRS